MGLQNKNLAYITSIKADKVGNCFHYNLIFCVPIDDDEFVVTQSQRSEEEFPSRYAARNAARQFCKANGIRTTNSGWLKI
jgi:hypothetical protein